MDPSIRLPCKVCEQGTLLSKKVFRMSGPVVVIGYIFLIPSVIGILLSVLMFFGVIATSGSATDTASQAGIGLAAGVVIFFGVASFAGGLIGWLLVMKKRVLQCSTCGATVNAS